MFRLILKTAIPVLALAAAGMVAGAAPGLARDLHPPQRKALNLDLPSPAEAVPVWATQDTAELEGHWSHAVAPTPQPGVRPMVKLNIDPHAVSRADQVAILGLRIPLKPGPQS